jgi:hypothetical protein
MFEREDWELFRTIEGLCSRAGVSRDKIAMLVAKELVDNALDTGALCKVDLLEDGIGFFVQDDGPGIDPNEVGDLFSINRPMRSTKLWRLPTRGALGNGLRVVAGAVLATCGDLKVYTSGQAMNLIPCFDGTTKVDTVGIYDGKGTRVEVHLGPDAGPINRNTLNWAYSALALAYGENYKGKTSPRWYTSRNFYELCQAAKDMTLRGLVSQFEGCSDGAITTGFKGRQASEITLDEAQTLLDRMKTVSKPVKSNRLGYCNNENIELLLGHYAKIEGSYQLVSNSETIEIPYVIEAWAKFQDRESVEVHVNRTPITAEIGAYQIKTELHLSGCNLAGVGYVYPIDIGRRPVRVILNIITPYMPITSTGKSPDLQYLREGIVDVIKKSVRKAKRNAPKGERGRSQKDIVFEMIPRAPKEVGGGHKFSLRQMLYFIRTFVKTELNEELRYSNFGKIVTAYENECGEIEGLYRDDRGAVYHPHVRDEIPLGDRTIEVYKPPAWTFNKVLYCEKEGFFPILQAVKWPEKHDCALLTSKGQPTRAARDFIDAFANSEEELLFFCIHDADHAGTIIYQSLQEATEARPARKVQVINLGLEPWEGLEMGLDSEPIDSEDERAVAKYIPPKWAEWLQKNRIELNTMTTPRFLQWLDNKMEKFGNGKLIPPEEVISDELREKTREKLAQEITDRILKENDAEGQIEQAFEKLRPVLDDKAEKLIEDMPTELADDPYQSWRDSITRAAHDLVMMRNM